jgi:hypothetical protein
MATYLPTIKGNRDWLQMELLFFGGTNDFSTTNV